MEENKKDFIEWVKAHKAQLIIAGVGVAALIAAVVGMKNKDALTELWAQFQNQLKKTPQALPEMLEETEVTSTVTEVNSPRSYNYSCTSFDVSQHVRNLSGGRHHSVEKGIEAEKLGYHLLPNQTYVKGYTKRPNAA